MLNLRKGHNTYTAYDNDGKLIGRLNGTWSRATNGDAIVAFEYAFGWPVYKIVRDRDDTVIFNNEYAIGWSKKAGGSHA